MSNGEEAALSDSVRNDVQNMILSRYMFGLCFIGQKSPLIRTDRQKHGRAGRSGMPGEYIEFIEEGLAEYGQGTHEYRMAETLHGQLNFRLDELEDSMKLELQDWTGKSQEI
ncbi:MAG: hypothetical protein HQL28_07245, partial [Candidatus Omnitrophica bacterium]|nr:hypothetical protein [Candidatus Omnitrophota bacterium]